MDNDDNKDKKSEDIMLKLKSLNGFIDFTKLSSDKLSTANELELSKNKISNELDELSIHNENSTTETLKITVSKRTRLDLCCLNNLLNNEHCKLKYPSPIKIIGRFKINFGNSSYEEFFVHIYTNIANGLFMFQLADLPQEFWYLVNSVKDIDEFLKVYSNELSETTSSKIMTYVRYDLKRNSNFTLTMVERYMFLSQYISGPIKGPLCSDESTDNAFNCLSTFDLVTKYYNTALIQDNNGRYYEISGKSRYSRSKITIFISFVGVTVEISYVKNDGKFKCVIDKINKEIGSDFDLDLPIDVVLFLCPFAPIGVRKILELVSDDDKEFVQKISIDKINMLRHLCVDIVQPLEFIETIKKINKKLMDNINDLNPVNVENKLNNLIKLCKVIITKEYLSITLKEENTQSNKSNKRELVKKVVKHMKKRKDSEFLDSVYLKDEIKDY